MTLVESEHAGSGTDYEELIDTLGFWEEFKEVWSGEDLTTFGKDHPYFPTRKVKEIGEETIIKETLEEADGHYTLDRTIPRPPRGESTYIVKEITTDNLPTT